jgi:hypothetical protein
MHASNRAPEVLSYHQHQLIAVSTDFQTSFRLLMMATIIIVPVLLKSDSSWDTSTWWNLSKNFVIFNLLSLHCTLARLLSHMC